MTPVIRVPKITPLSVEEVSFLQHALHFAAGQFFQARAHNGHAVQKQRNATQQRGNVCDIHNDTPKNALPFDPLLLPHTLQCVFPVPLRQKAAALRPAAQRHCTKTALGFIIASFTLPQQGLFYKKITFSTHFSVS